ncbi:hypothetical protein KXD93_19855 [Mucilaginibacter sp. BJC16-A38]|uniref:hypothetical protein n=1 Tax=Mucilaginibacter phenanthrenivorans TaxID=1234842 RepID=UPI002157D287|nr:hypothetical protein [Mucilaginibacter phenanthrenivorans]MCR8559916.1 hypothetical protein [Mucilaginibacter phenanthrenivorans]
MGLATSKDIQNIGSKDVSIGEKLAITGRILQTIASIFIPEEGKGGIPETTIAKPPISDAPSLGSRANDIHSAVPAATQNRTTIAVADGIDANGKAVRVVGSSENRLRPAQRQMLKSNEIEATGPGHAETTVLNHAVSNGISITDIGASRPICLLCQTAIDAAGAKPVTPIKTANKTHN